METFIMLLVGAGIVWLIRYYRWCEVCKQKARLRGSDMCVSCQAEFDLALEKMLNRPS